MKIIKFYDIHAKEERQILTNKFEAMEGFKDGVINIHIPVKWEGRNDVSQVFATDRKFIVEDLKE